MRKTCLPLIALSLIFLAANLFSQDTLRIRTVNLGNLPLVQIRIAAPPSWDLSASEVTVLENGKKQAAAMRCRDTTLGMSVVFCLDASGSIIDALEEIKQAVHLVIDSLRWNDRAGAVSFSGTARLVSPLLADHESVKRAVDTIKALGATAMYDGLDSAIVMLQNEPGPKFIVLLTDGQDNSSFSTLDIVADKLRRAGITVIAIPFGYPGERTKMELRRLALQSNGLYFPVFNRAGLAEKFEEIASFVTALYCDLEYTAANCRDSIRHIEITAENAGAVIRADTTVRSPVVPSRLDVIVSAPDELIPPAVGKVLFTVPGPLSTGLLRFRVRVAFPETFLPLGQPPVSKGDIPGPQMLTVKKIAPGEIEVSSGGLIPTRRSGTLFSLNLAVAFSDSSRLYPIVIREAEFSQGCPIPVDWVNDTLEICACRQEYPVSMDTLPTPFSGGEITVPLALPGEVEAGSTVEFRGTLLYDSSLFTPRSVDADSLNGTGWIVRWEIAHPGAIRIHAVSLAQVRNTRVPFLYVRFEGNTPLEARPALFSIQDGKVYANCCPLATPGASEVVLVDGLCRRISSRSSGVVLEQNVPNPANPVTEVPFSLDGSDASGQLIPVRLSLFDMMGREVARIIDKSLLPGSYRVLVDVSFLPSGTYFYRLRAGATVLTRTMTVVK